MFKLVLEKRDKPEIKLPTFARSLKKQENFRKTSTFTLLTMLKPLTVWITTNWKILKEMGIPDHLNLPLEKSVCRSGSNIYNWTCGNEYVKAVHGHHAYLTHYAEYIMRNARLG